ncbi:MAG: DMT family transporter, partial [Candidatus Bathyarchaeia archaeon]
VSQITLSSATLFLIAGAFLWAVTTIYYKKFLTHVNPEIVNVVQFPIGTVFLITVTSMLDKLTFSVDITYILSILYIAILGSAVASTIWLALIRIEEATIVSTSSLAVPAAALFFGWIFLKEPVRPSLLLGFALILTGIYLVNKH